MSPKIYFLRIYSSLELRSKTYFPENIFARTLICPNAEKLVMIILETNPNNIGRRSDRGLIKANVHEQYFSKIAPSNSLTVLMRVFGNT